MTDRTRSVVRWCAVGATALASGVLWVVFRLIYGWWVAFPTFLGACDRIEASGLPLLPTDRMCFESFWASMRINYSWTGFVQVAGLCLAGIFLAATGRRTTAFLPILAVLWLDGSYFLSWMGIRTDIHQGLGTWEMAAAMLCAPILVAVLLRQEPVPERLRARWWAWLAGVAVLGSATVAGWWMLRQGWIPLLKGAWMWAEFLLSAGLVLGMIAFASLLGTDKRLWPWSLVPVAILLSAGPSLLFTIPIEQPHPLALGGFGMAIPLFLLGLVWSGLRSLVQRIDGWDRKEVAPLFKGDRRRAATVLNVTAVSLLVASLVAFHNDPYEEWLRRPLPTYLGDRTRANDVAARLNLADALAAMKQYRAEHGTFEGFRAADGARLAPTIPWSDAPPRDQEWGDVSYGVVPMASGGAARLGTVSRAGSAWCIQQQGGRTTYGRSESLGGPARPAAELLASASRHCGDLAWSDPMLEAPPERKCGSEPGYLICRMVQVLVHRILARDDPPTTFNTTFWGNWGADVPLGWHIAAEKAGGRNPVRIWSGSGGALLSVTVTPLGPVQGLGEVMQLIPSPSSAPLGVDTAYSARSAVGGRSYRFTVHIGRHAEQERRVLLENAVASLSQDGQGAVGIGGSYPL